jgi:hypothetical protein
MENKTTLIKGMMRSKTIWFALGLEIFGVLQLELPNVSEQLGPYYGWIMIGIGIGIKVLRTLTTSPLQEKGA